MRQIDQHTYELDGLDRRLLAALAASPRAGIFELARTLAVARNTVQSRLAKLTGSGVVRGFPPEVDLGLVGYKVSAFVTLQIAQGRGRHVLDHLTSVPQVVEVHRTTGAGDLLCRVVARDNRHLADVLDRMLDVPGINRTTTAVVLETPVASRLQPAVDDVATDPRSEGGASR
ncbi:MAG: Lrp/AsnC family transcriptional regulator [Acidimicrobiales bacterium]